MENHGLRGFLPHVNESFVTVRDGVEVPMVLAEASALGDGVSSSAFALIFRSESAVLYPQDMYRLSHPVMGEQDIFLVPVGRHDSGFVYEAVFN